MKKRLATVLVALAAMLGILSTAAPAQAYIDDPYINGRKFWSPSVCVGSTLLQSYYRVGYEAQIINNQTQTLALDFSTNCAADGYPPSRRMVVGTFQDAGNPSCMVLTNQYHDDYNGFWRWTNGPGMYLNTGRTECVGTQTRRDYWIGRTIAWHLGLNTLDDTNPDEWRIMNDSAWTRDHVGGLTATEGVKLDQIYYGNFCNSGTVC